MTPDQRVAAARQFVASQRPRFDLLLPARALTELYYELRRHTVALLDVITQPDGSLPGALVPFAERWVIRRELSAWVAEQRTGSAIRVVVGHEPAELADKLAAIEAGSG